MIGARPFVELYQRRPERSRPVAPAAAPLVKETRYTIRRSETTADGVVQSGLEHASRYRPTKVERRVRSGDVIVIPLRWRISDGSRIARRKVTDGSGGLSDLGEVISTIPGRISPSSHSPAAHLPDAADPGPAHACAECTFCSQVMGAAE